MNELKGYLNGLNTSQNFSHLREVSKIQQLQSLTLSPPPPKIIFIIVVCCIYYTLHINIITNW